MSFWDFGEEQLTQPSLGMSEPEVYSASHLLELLYELSCRIGDLLPYGDSKPVTIYLGGDAAAVLNNFTRQSANGIRVFAATPLEARLLARVANSLETDNQLRAQLADTTLQDAMDAVPQIMQRLTADAANIEPIYSCPALNVIIPRWEIPYAIKIHELVFDDHASAWWASRFLVFYLFATRTTPSLAHILESSIQEHVQALYPQDKRYVSRSIFDKVNQSCKEHFDVEPILFEG